MKCDICKQDKPVSLCKTCRKFITCDVCQHRRICKIVQKCQKIPGYNDAIPSYKDKTKPTHPLPYVILKGFASQFISVKQPGAICFTKFPKGFVDETKETFEDSKDDCVYSVFPLSVKSMTEMIDPRFKSICTADIYKFFYPSIEFIVHDNEVCALRYILIKI